MGQVYRAIDTKLNRPVALKILPAAFAADPDRLARFQREAQVLASLNHPGIAAIYGIEEADATRALVLELVDGPTLAERISKGPIPVDDALPIAKQIAEALEAAHEAGVIHRDLKPANIKVREDGTVKVLDFGLAKALDMAAEGDPSQSPTVTAAATQMGVILGTAAYMSLEQARGKPVDTRAGIWALGVVIYEMLTASQPFQGPTVTDTLAAVVKTTPGWGALPGETPGSVRRLLRRCLESNPRRRLQHVGDARLELDEPADEVDLPETGKWSRPWALVTATAVLTAAVSGALMQQVVTPRSEPAPVDRFTVIAASGEPLQAYSPLALSRDGRQLVYSVGMTDEATGTALYLHRFDDFSSRRLEGADNPTMPFFSPDGDSIGFLAIPGGTQQLRLAGGAPTALLDATQPHGANWGHDGRLVFNPNWGEPLRVLKPGQTESSPLTTLNADAGERGHLWPQVLPDNRGVLFTVWASAPSWDQAQLAVADLDTGEHRVILRGGAYGRYAASGHLVFWRGDALLAAPFDIDSLEAGPAVTVIDGVRFTIEDGAAHFALSEEGTLAYVPGTLDSLAESFVIGRTDQQRIPLDTREAVGHLAFSPDGRYVAGTLFQDGQYGIGVYDVERAELARVTAGDDNLRPTWSPDGSRLTYLSDADGRYGLYSINADGSGNQDQVVPTGQSFDFRSRAAWSPDGAHLIYTVMSEATGLELWIASSRPGADPRPLRDTEADETQGMFSPDGRFVVYHFAQGGVSTVIVHPFPDLDSRQWNVGAGRFPVWRADGREILYVTDDGVVSVSVESDSASASLSLGRHSSAASSIRCSPIAEPPDMARSE